MNCHHIPVFVFNGAKPPHLGTVFPGAVGIGPFDDGLWVCQECRMPLKVRCEVKKDAKPVGEQPLHVRMAR